LNTGNRSYLDLEHGDTIVRLKKLSNIFIELMYGDPCTRQVQRLFTGL